MDGGEAGQDPCLWGEWDWGSMRSVFLLHILSVYLFKSLRQKQNEASQQPDQKNDREKGRHKQVTNNNNKRLQPPQVLKDNKRIL